MKKPFLKSSYIKWIAFAVWMLIWFFAAHAVGNNVLLPSPRATILALISLVGTGKFWMNVFWTVLRTVLGIVISFGLGTACAALANKNLAVREFLRLPVNFFKSIPVMAIIIYVILVVKSTWVAVVVCFLMCFPIAYTNILNGLQSLDPSRLELGASLGLSKKQMIKYIIRPSLDTQIKTALSLITGMSWKVVVASEVLAIPKFSIGYQMLNSKYYLETPELFAYMIVLIVLSLLMEKLVAMIAGLNTVKLGMSLEREAEGAPIISLDDSPARISFKKVSKSFNSEDGSVIHALEDFSYEFTPGITAVLAPSGAGKTTMARIIKGFEEPDSGTLTGAKNSRMAYLFQEDRLLPWLSVKGNMLLALLAGNCTGQAAEAAVAATAEKLEIADALLMMPSELSGGMAHRAAMGRTLLFGGEVLILDEPFRGLDEELRGRIIEDISDELRPTDRPKTVILITHDEDLAEKLADRVVRL